MKVIFISGPSGSGKTTLSNHLIEEIENGFILSTDNYYKTGLISKLLSKFLKGYFDKYISFNYRRFKKEFNFILKNKISKRKTTYNFKKKAIKNFSTEIKKINVLIIEGIFAKQFSSTLQNQNYFFFELKIDKKDCMNRVVQRDVKERGKNKKQAENDFLNSWDIYYKKFNNRNYNTEIIITKNTNIEQILKKIYI